MHEVVVVFLAHFLAQKMSYQFLIFGRNKKFCAIVVVAVVVSTFVIWFSCRGCGECLRNPVLRFPH